MRDIADKFVGGVEHIDKGRPASRRALSLRAILLGFVGVVLLSGLEPYNQSVFENTMLIGNALPVGVLFLVLMLVLVVNPVLAALPQARSVFHPARLAVFWACLLPVSLWMWRGPARFGEAEADPRGFSGQVVLSDYLTTGLLLLVLGLLARVWNRRRRSDDHADVTGQTWRPGPVVLLVAACVLPPLLMPMLSNWLTESASGSSAPMSSTVVYMALTLAALVVGGLVVRVLRRVAPLSAGELVVITTIMLPACAVIWSGFHRLWASQLVAPFYYMETNPRWVPLVNELPSWLVPAADPENVDVVYNFYAGESGVPWSAWLPVALRWMPFVLAFFGGIFFLMALFRRQWEEAEKLSFPLAQITLETVRPPAPGRLLNEMLGSKLFWWSTCLVVALQSLYALHVYYPDVPEIVFEFDLHAALETPPWRHLPHHIRAKDAFFIMVGVAFFLSTDMSLSLWAFVIILGLVEMTGKNFQYGIHDHFDDHQIGAYIAYAGVIVWVARRHLARAFRSLRRRPPDDDNDMLAERWAAIGFLVCFTVASAWLSWTGLPWYVAMLVALVIFVLALVVGRIVSESGVLFVQYRCWPHVFAESTFPQLLTPKTHALIHFSTIAPTADARESLAPYAFNSARMADGVQSIPRRGLFWIWMAALVVALFVAGAAQLSIAYHRGALNDEFAARMLPERTYNSSADFADLLEQPADKIEDEWSTHRAHVGIGAAVVLLLCFLRYRFLAWPLHPIGFLMAHTYPMQVFWLSIMIGWLCKTLVMRFGGVPVYRKLCPAFLGMIVGTTFSSVFWIVVKIASYTTGDEGRAILFLPS